MSDIEERTMRRVYLRLIPFLFLLLVVNYLDRVNIGFAALRMNSDLGLSASAFGLGASIFFVGYALFEVPSNIILHRVGARVWIARILISWGLVSGAMAFVQGEKSLYLVRFLLGVAEGGFLPGVVFYLTAWFPKRHRSKANAGVVAATALASVVGAPLSGTILTYVPPGLGLQSWQWMFIAEAVPAIVLGVVVLVFLTERPDEADWLPQDEKQWLVQEMQVEHASFGGQGELPLAQVARLGRIWILAALFTCLLTALYGVLLWLPLILKSLGGLSDLEIGFVSAIPFCCAGLAMVLLARRSDRLLERKWHLASALMVGGLGLIGSAYASYPVVAFLLLCLAAAGIWGGLGIFWSLTSDFLSGSARAAGIALINTLAQLGGLIGPWMTGLIRDKTGNFSAALLALAAAALLASLIAALLQDRLPGHALGSLNARAA